MALNTQAKQMSAAHAAGLQHIVNQLGLNNALGQAAAELQYAPARPRQIQLNTDVASTNNPRMLH